MTQIMAEFAQREPHRQQQQPMPQMQPQQQQQTFQQQQQQTQLQQQQQQKKEQPEKSQKCKPPTEPTPTRHECDILLNNFLIKKRRFRVLLNCDHIVWERLDASRSPEAATAAHANKKSKKEREVETEQLSHKAAYGDVSEVVHIDDIVRVVKSASSKGATGQNHVQATTTTTTTTTTSVAPTDQFLTLHYALRINKSPTDCNRWRVRRICFFNADAFVVQQWYLSLTKMLARKRRVQRLLVFINPYGGRRQGLQTYERHCKPLFQLAGIDASCIISQRANQIRDILMSHDLTQYDAVCCVGGDGTVAEVINGLLFRSIRDHGLDPRRPAFVPKPCLPVGIVPAGSTDTVAYSLHGTSDERSAAIHLILGQRRGLDICSVRNREGILRFCASVLSYGYLGDVAAKSERYRWMGTKRYEYTGVRAFLMNRGYEAEIRMLLSDDVSAQQQQASLSQVDGVRNESQPLESPCYVNCQRCTEAGVNNVEKSVSAVDGTGEEERPTSSNLSLQAPKVDDVVANKMGSIYTERKSIVMEKDMDSFKNICDSDIVIEKKPVDETTRDSSRQKPCDNFEESNAPPLGVSQESINSSEATTTNNNNLEDSPAQWKVVKGTFFMISGANITCACSRSPNGISRYSHLGDGHLDLILVRKTSLMNNVRFVINTMGRNGDIRQLPFVEVYRTRQFSFRTLRPTSSEEEYSVRGSCQPITSPHDAADDDEDDEKVSRWNCDGEVVNDLDITMSSHCQLVDVFMRGPHRYVKNTSAQTNAGLCCCGSTS